MGSPLIIVEDLSKRYKNAQEFSLQHVSFTVSGGDKFGILGPNGAGKTTLISIMCGIFNPSGGKVKFTIPGLTEYKIGLVPQDYSFYNELTASQNLEYFGVLYHLEKKEIRERTEKILTLLGLLNYANKKVVTFSGGMKRRLNLAIGILHSPAILFLDEPTVGVDIQSRNAIIQFLNSINESGTTIIYTSHHIQEAEEFCNKIALLDYGKIIAFDETGNLKKKNNSVSLTEVVLKLTGEDYRDDI
jgi:ABC-2 type transport system ATP-binding protein